MARFNLMRQSAALAMLVASVACTDAADVTSQSSILPETVEKPTIARGSIVFNDRAGYYAFFVVDSNGVGRKRISPEGSLDIDPAISADGTRIAFASAEPNADWFDLWVMNADGTNRTRLAQMPGGTLRPAWSPDGTRIVFHAFPALNYAQLYAINADGTGLTRLTNHTGSDTSPEWSPDGKRILFSRDANGWENKGIFVVDPDGSNVRQLTSGQWDTKATWSPDGTHIAFIREGPTGGGNVFFMNADGTNAKQLTQSEYPVSDPTWAPDGRSIAFAVVSTSKMCRDDDYGGSDELFACGTDVKRVSLAGIVDARWVLTSAYDPTWRR